MKKTSGRCLLILTQASLQILLPVVYSTFQIQSLGRKLPALGGDLLQEHLNAPSSIEYPADSDSAVFYDVSSLQSTSIKRLTDAEWLNGCWRQRPPPSLTARRFETQWLHFANTVTARREA